MKLRSRSLVVTTLMAFVTAAVSAPSGVDAPPIGKGIDVLTLHVQRISTLERALHNAVNNRDSVSLDKLLSPYFEIRRARGVIVQRDAWLREGVVFDGELHQLSAYEVGNSAIANFTLVSSGRPNRFVVDVWTLDQNEWRLRVRFETTEAR